jgi:hypothetical protein
MALFQLTLTSLRQESNPFANVFGYKTFLAITPPVTAVLNTAFIAQVVPDIQAICQVDTVFRSVLSINLDDASDFTDTAIAAGTIGLRAGDPLPEFCAWGYQYVRKVRGQRSGAKRFGVVSESDQSGGGPAAGVVAALNTLATQLAAPLTVGLVDTFFPVILVRPAPGGSVWGSHDLNTVIFKRLTSQRTRRTT